MLSAHPVERLLLISAILLAFSISPAAAQQATTKSEEKAYVQHSFSPQHVRIAAEARRFHSKRAKSISPQKSRRGRPGLVRPASGTVISTQEEMPYPDDELVEVSDGEIINLGGMVEDGSPSCEQCLRSSGWGPEILPGFWVDHLSIFGGVHAAKNEGNLGQDASFGFHYGLNFGTAAKNIILPPSIGWQIGFQGANSNLNGSSFSTDERSQMFVTFGLFRRGDYGLQGGIVMDYMRDEWYYDASLAQARGELSMAITPAKSLGFRFATSVTEDTVVAQASGATELVTWATKDQYKFFYRTRLMAGGRGEAQVFAGFTGDSEGIIGGISRVPLHNGWALETDYAYVIPSESKQNGANEREAWNVQINLVWYPGSLSCGSCFRYHRPMFDVANNGSMIVRRETN
ncbi:MAG: hypothetical protein GY768_15765 [Planctomycetaceae bacterium]|nr:hypothetical protein [Planctomycetaceae bacterium]